MSNLKADVYTDLGAGHHMQTTARINGNSGLMVAETRIWSTNNLGGFHGGVVVSLQDGNGVVIERSPIQVYGVDGRWIGTSDRTGVWTCQFNQNNANRATSLGVVQTWNPIWPAFDQVLQVGVQILQAIAQMVASGEGGGDTGGTDDEQWDQEPWSEYATIASPLTSGSTTSTGGPQGTANTGSAGDDTVTGPGRGHVGTGAGSHIDRAHPD